MVMYLVVTGFGKFKGQEKNPSQALVEALPDYLKERGKGIGGALDACVSCVYVSKSLLHLLNVCACQEMAASLWRASSLCQQNTWMCAL